MARVGNDKSGFPTVFAHEPHGKYRVPKGGMRTWLKVDAVGRNAGGNDQILHHINFRFPAAGSSAAKQHPPCSSFFEKFGAMCSAALGRGTGASPGFQTRPENDDYVKFLFGTCAVVTQIHGKTFEGGSVLYWCGRTIDIVGGIIAGRDSRS